MAEAAAGALYAVEHLIEGAVVAAKGIYDPTLPLKATLKPLVGVSVPLAYHSVSLVKGRAYLFGGKTGDGEGAPLASNDVHVVILPSSGVESMDYKKLDATKDAPPARYGHSSAVIEERIYIFGGCGQDRQPIDENGRVWVYDTATNTWSHFDPSSKDAFPPARSNGAAVASVHPRQAQRRADQDVMPQHPPDPETTMPDIPDTDTYGTFVVQGGQGIDGHALNDVWTFDISSRTWKELPDCPPPSSPHPSLAMVDNRLYTFSAGQTSYLDVSRSSYDDRSGQGELGLAPLGPWQSIPPTSSSPEKPHPGERSAASMVPVTTGQGRNYLLLLGGESQAGETLEDIWTLQLKPEGMTAASFKDAARMAVKMDTREATWSEVKYLDSEGVMIQEGQPGRGLGVRRGGAAGKGGEVDGASVVVWGGIGADGKARGDGLMVTVE
ncbi:uncharacterized protein LTR77_005821 [Saxophila tyrrhenica]|uniref:Galactose oxidase n=1 Tax=Saxophila tyrrhenica TaxID=1690608 RepID=A0AAV9PA01_9PEZI|nr:hypothetical protein LTR77_005821 [Saxophila tyrrhenica]